MSIEAPQAGRSRSPSFPLLSLPDAIVAARKVYEREHRTPTTREVVAEQLGYKTLHGTARRVVAALGQYGLLDDAPKGRVRVSELGEALIHPRDPSELRILRERALHTPTVYGMVFSHFGESIPSERTLESFLIRDQKFTPDAAKVCAKAFRESVAFAEEQVDPRDVEHQGRPGNGDIDENPHPAIGDKRGRSMQDNYHELERLDSSSLPVLLSSATRAELRITGVLGASEARKLAAWLDGVAKPWIQFMVLDTVENTDVEHQDQQT
ncbi:MAG: hypothetical protein M3Y56_06035 [Armatimonadota bacterium]|nr:hypothetical protein [Armatimonadota bacterium]